MYGHDVAFRLSPYHFSKRGRILPAPVHEALHATAFTVELVPHDPQWTATAAQEADELRRPVGASLLAVHHIGSTAVPGLCAKPIIDILGVVTALGAIDELAETLEAAGYRCWGEYGIAGRRYVTRDDATTGRRAIQLHVFTHGSHAIERQLAFRDYLRADRDVLEAYEREKHRCTSLYPSDSHAYAD